MDKSNCAQSPVVLKVSFAGELRRVVLHDAPPTIREVHASVRSLFSSVKDYSLTYEDDEGDAITISTDQEIVEALRSNISGSLLRLKVTLRTVSPSSFQLSPEEKVFVHSAFCDGCRNRIQGIRYKCSVCPDFDLCEKCESERSFHPLSHAMLKLTKDCAHSHLHFPHLARRRAYVPSRGYPTPNSPLGRFPNSPSDDLTRLTLKCRDSHQCPSSVNVSTPAPAPAPAPSLAPSPAPSPSPSPAPAPSPAADIAPSPAPSMEAESDDRKATRSVLTSMGIADDVITHFMDLHGANLELILSAIFEDGDEE